MGVEIPKIEQPKEDESKKEEELQEQRILSDAELIQGGAKIEQGVLRLSGEQIEEIRSEMRKKELASQKEQYSQEQEEEILKVAQQMGDPWSSSEWREKMAGLKSINSEKFEILFSSKINWDSVREKMDYRFKQAGQRGRSGESSRETYFEDAATLKELCGNEIEKHIQISEKGFDDTLDRFKTGLSPKFWQRDLYGRDFQLSSALSNLANLKIINQERFNEKLKIDDELKEKLRNEIEGLLKKKDEDFAGGKTGKMEMVRGARILGIMEEQKEK